MKWSYSYWLSDPMHAWGMQLEKMSCSMPMATNYSGWRNFFSWYYEHACGTPVRMGCLPLKLSPRTRVPRTSCPPGQPVLWPCVPPGQLVLEPRVPLRISCPPMKERLQNSYIILCAILSNQFIVDLNSYKNTWNNMLDYAWLAQHIRCRLQKTVSFVALFKHWTQK